MRRFQTQVSWGTFLVLTLASVPSLSTAQGVPQAAGPEGLHIIIVGGEGAINNVKLRTAREPIVEVQDRNNRPVAGAAVSFLVPQTGASGTFSNGSNLLRVLTDAKGRAVAGGFRPNAVPGAFKIEVTASFQGQVSTTAITQTNALAGAAGSASTGGAASGSGGTGGAGGGAAGAGGAGAGGAAAGGLSAATIGAIAGGAAAAVAVAAKVATGSKKDDSSSTPPPSITAMIGDPGAPVIGPSAISRGRRMSFAEPRLSGFAAAKSTTAWTRAASGSASGSANLRSDRSRLLGRSPLAGFAGWSKLPAEVGPAVSGRLRGLLQSRAFVAQPSLARFAVTPRLRPVSASVGSPAVRRVTGWLQTGVLIRAPLGRVFTRAILNAVTVRASALDAVLQRGRPVRGGPVVGMPPGGRVVGPAVTRLPIGQPSDITPRSGLPVRSQRIR